MTPPVKLWPEAAYRLDLPDPIPDDLSGVAAEVFRRVWRTTLSDPGFVVVGFAGSVGSHDLRRVMIDLVGAFPAAFVPERLDRFDQQVTSRFHRDGAPPASQLILGYEASAVRGRVFAADAHRAAADAGLGISGYLAAFNPMLPAGADRLRPYVTELAVPHGRPYLVVLNNGLVTDAGGPLGILHRAEVPDPDPAATRVINSAGFVLAGGPAPTPLPPDAVAHFLARTDLD